MEGSDYLSLKELSARTSMSEATLRSHLGGPSGIPYHRLHPRGKILVKWDDFVEWMDGKRVAAETALEDPIVREIFESVTGVH